MRRRILVLLIVFSAAFALFSAEIQKTDRITVYMRGTLSPSFASEKVFSYPAKNGNIHALMGIDAAADIYKNDESAKMGISTHLFVSYPVISRKYTSFKGEDISERKLVLNASAGLVFRCTPSDYLDASVALRFGVLSYDYFSQDLILTLTVEPRVDYFLTDDIFVTAAISITNGFIKFTPGHEETWYESGYTTVISRLELGAGWKIGGDRKR